MSLTAAKEQFRKEVRKRLVVLTTQALEEQSKRALKPLLVHKPYQQAKSIGVYLHMPKGEIYTAAIVRHALEHGKTVYVPYMHELPDDQAELPPKNKDELPEDQTELPRKVMDMVALRNWADYDSFELDKWNIPTVPAHSLHWRRRILGDQRAASSENTLDMILMPGCAFDLAKWSNNITRLGHGRGYYDYFLHRYAQAHDGQLPTLYGLALNEQWFGNTPDRTVPVGAHDVPLDGVFLGTGEVVIKSTLERLEREKESPQEQQQPEKTPEQQQEP